VNPGLFLRGLAIGFAVAFALGPIGLLVIRRTIDRGWRYGFLSGLGVATADASYAAVAAFGLTALTALLVGIDRMLGIVGGAVLIVLALRGIRGVLEGDDAAPAAERPSSRLDGAAGAWASMVGLTLTNPATILSFTALFASIGAGTGGPAGAVLVVAGVFTGSVAWWALLTGLVAGLRARLTPRVVRWLNVASAVIIAAFGVVAIAIGIGA
jgi:threonine/homoserine/homoserine lactone efflux protein